MASVVTNLLTGGLLQGVSGLINTIRGKSPEDAEKLAELAAKYQSDILAADQAQRQAQSDVNRAEAANPNMFVAGWRYTKEILSLRFIVKLCQPRNTLSWRQSHVASRPLAFSSASRP